MKFDIAKFKNDLSDHNFIRDIHYFEEIDSTNTYLLKELERIDHVLALTEFQTAGRGRFSRKWISNKYENLMFSLGFENLSNRILKVLNFYVPLVIADSIKDLYAIDVKIKWPNDIMFDNKKLSGILIESISENLVFQKLVIGIGINCNQTIFPEEIMDRTTSLRLILNKPVEREKLLARIVDRISHDWNNLFDLFDEIYNSYKTKCSFLGKTITVVLGDKEFTGTLHNITKDGELILIEFNRKYIFKSGEITIKKE